MFFWYPSHGAIVHEHQHPCARGQPRPGNGCRHRCLGCGIGQYGHYFREKNAQFNWTGYDGALNVDAFTRHFVQWADITVPQYFRTVPYSWVMCLEVAEHVPGELEDFLIDNVHRHNTCGTVLSWAVPGQSGHQHINNQSPAYVAAKMAKLGYTEDTLFTARGQAAAKYSWFKDTFRVFRKNGAPAWCH